MTAIQGYVKVPVRLQSFSGLVKFYIMDLPNTSGLNAILGQTWTKEFQANLDYASEGVHFQKEEKSAKLFCSKPKKVEANSTLLSMAQFKKARRSKQSKGFMVAATELSAESNADLLMPAALPLQVRRFEDVFQELPPGLPPLQGIGHTINTGESDPVSKTPVIV